MAIETVGRSLAASAAAGPVDSKNDSQGAETMVRQVAQTRLIVLSTDDQVIEMVRSAAQAVARVACARDLQHLMQSMPGAEPDVLVVDGANIELAPTIERLARNFPDVVTIIIGTKEESTELLQLAAAGQIFRFLLRPLSSGAVRLALSAAVARRKDPSRPAAAPAPQKKSKAMFGVLALALVTMIGGLWAAMPMLAPKKVSKNVPLQPAPTAAQQTSSAGDSVQTQLSLAEQAMKQGQTTAPGGAIEMYRNVLARDANNAAALAGIRAIADQQLERAEQALVAENLDEAQRALAMVRDIDAGHPRLQFLETQMTRERELRNLRQQQVRRLVESAQADMQSGNLLGLVSGGAVDTLIEARKLDSGDPAVVRAVRELTVALGGAVRKANAAGDTQRAQAYTSAARKLGISSQALSAGADAAERTAADNDS